MIAESVILPKGRFITLEGGEGAGKSTQIELLGETLRNSKKVPDLIVTREPGGSAGAEQIRHLLVTGRVDRWTPMTETILHFAARRDHLERTIWPALERGDWVISDRFADSTRAYQGYGQGVDLDQLERLYEASIGNFAPDLTLILDIDPEKGIARARERLRLFGNDEDRYERMDVAFHEKIRQGFLAIAAANPERCVVIDAERDLKDVQKDIRCAIRKKLGIALNGG